jgi:hypothetical protein
MSDIFMSFIHEESFAAESVHDFIEELFGPSVSIFRSSDENAIYAGDDWMARIFTELSGAKVLISMLTPASVSRPWINFEAGAAWMSKIKVIPVCVGGLKVTDLPKPYSSLQGVEISTHDGAYYLASSIAHHLNIAVPYKPLFGMMQSMAILSGRDSNEEKQKAIPYNRLVHVMETYIFEPPPEK